MKLPIAAIASALGLKIPDDTIAQLEELLPQIPGKVVEVLEVINKATENFDARLVALEASNQAIQAQNLELRTMLDERTNRILLSLSDVQHSVSPKPPSKVVKNGARKH